ncbi:MAG: hypothetical protein V5A64_00425 [Candidatus Thermoplasmatota archaeon]
MKKRFHWYEKASFFAEKYFSWMIKEDKKTRGKIEEKFDAEYVNNLNFTGLQLSTFDIVRLSYAGAFLFFVLFLLLDLIILLLHWFNFFSIDFLTLFLMALVLFVVPFFVLNLLVNYPKTYARFIKIHSLGDIPEVLSYLVMYLKLVPNLENSVKFAASESSTSLARDLRKMLWDMEIRIYHGVDDALGNFATLWGEWSDYFKRSLHLVRSSIHEREEASRLVTLNRSLDVALDGTRDLMNKFASRLHQPTMFIYSIGIMIPLALVAMLPAAGLVGLQINILQVFFIYDVLLPLFIFYYTRRVLLTRPATFNPPVIPEDHPDLVDLDKNKFRFLAFLIGGLVALPGVIFIFLPVLFPDGSSVGFLDFVVDRNGLNSFFPVTLFLIWGFSLGFSFYCLSVYRPYKKIRDEIRKIETEFSDALYILGKRVNEEKSPEESFLYAAETMEGSEIAKVFSQTGYNLTAMHTSIDEALFNDDFGSLKHVYSDRVKAIMRLFVEGIKKSQKAVSVSIIRIADHLKHLQEVENKIRDQLYSLTSTLRGTVAVFAPIIGGITLSITKLITSILSDMSGKVPTETDLSSAGVSMPTVNTSFSVQNISPEFFVLVIGIYLIELIFLMVHFTNGIDEGDDKATYMYSLGKTIPISIMVFTLTVILGQFLFSSIVQV